MALEKFTMMLDSLDAEMIANAKLTSMNARNSSQEINSILGRSSARKFDELGPVESRSLGGLNATPLAGPVNAQGQPG